MIFDGTLAKSEAVVDLNKLSLSHVQGTFIILGTGILVATMTFATEIASLAAKKGKIYEK